MVIPALNEAETLPRLLDDLTQVALSLDIVVADGGSTDATRDVAERGGATVVCAPRGRALQMNAGAAVLDVDWLCFLHADVRLPNSARADLERAIAVIEKVVGTRPVGYRAPGFSISEDTLWALEILADAGLRFDSSIFPAKRAHGSSPGARTVPHEVRFADGGSLIEFPISVTTLAGRRIGYCGGGYLRLFPYWFIKARIAAANARGEPVVVYVHPRDIDPDQPRLEMPLARRFRSYVNLHTAAGKLRRLLSDFRFGSVSEALALGD